MNEIKVNDEEMAAFEKLLGDHPIAENQKVQELLARPCRWAAPVDLSTADPAERLALARGEEAGGYTAVDVASAAAEGFRDGRASVVVELPLMPKAQRTDEEATYSAGGCDMLRKCQAAIIAAGGTVKA